MTAETGTGVRAKRMVCLADTMLTQLLIAIHERDTNAMREHCGNLAEWLDKGGFAPDMEHCLERARLETVAKR